MEYLSLLYFAALIALSTAAEGVSYDYSNQTKWGELHDSVCGTGMRQSPILINSAGLEEGADLIDLVLSGWDAETTGTFENSGGRTLKFMPNSKEKATTENHQGTYTVEQFHLHWGATNNVGSEHVVDGQPASAAFHFVHRRTAGPSDAGNAFAVIGVLAVVDEDAEVTGVWSQLDVPSVQKYDSEAINATVTFRDLLPSSLTYYYYEGSLTTPPCSEVVQWFLLKESIAIPEDYMKQLREVESNSNGDLLTFNFREPQLLNGRTVTVHSDSDTVGAGMILYPFVSLLFSLSIMATVLL